MFYIRREIVKYWMGGSSWTATLYDVIGWRSNQSYEPMTLTQLGHSHKEILAVSLSTLPLSPKWGHSFVIKCKMHGNRIWGWGPPITSSQRSRGRRCGNIWCWRWGRSKCDPLRFLHEYSGGGHHFPEEGRTRQSPPSISTLDIDIMIPEATTLFHRLTLGPATVFGLRTQISGEGGKLPIAAFLQLLNRCRLLTRIFWHLMRWSSHVLSDFRIVTGNANFL